MCPVVDVRVVDVRCREVCVAANLPGRGSAQAQALDVGDRTWTGAGSPRQRSSLSRNSAGPLAVRALATADHRELLGAGAAITWERAGSTSVLPGPAAAATGEVQGQGRPGPPCGRS